MTLNNFIEGAERNEHVCICGCTDFECHNGKLQCCKCGKGYIKANITR